jgi:hypothetical protein
MSSLLPREVPRTLCITSDPTLRRALRRILNAAGATVEFADSLAEVNGAVSLLFIDRDCRKQWATADLSHLLGDDGTVVILGDSLEDDDVVSLLRQRNLDHVIADSQPPDEAELVVTSVKSLSGDIFGLEKYLAWGAKVHEIAVRSYEDKRSALFTVAEAAREVGARRPVIAKIESVTDELLMNALYDAPAIRSGISPRLRILKATEPPPTLLPDAGNDVALLRYACDGRYFAVSVQDDYGELHKEAILDHLQRARTERGRPKSPEEAAGGAGLGLYFILSSVTRFIANIDRGHRTEVICLFDVRQTGRTADSCARSLHIFTASNGRVNGHGT